MARIPLKEISSIFRRVGTGLEAGVDARKLWSRESERTSGRAHRAMDEISAAVDRGDTMTNAFANTGDAFPRLVHDLVAVGEQTGQLDNVLLRMSDHFEHLLGLRRLFLLAITWPSIQLVMAFLVIGLVIFVLGMIEPDPMFPVHDVVFGLRGIRGLVEYVVVTGSVCFGIWVLIVNWSRGKMGAHIVVPWIYRIPQLGTCLRTLALGRMAWTLSLTTDTPMDALESVRASLRGSGSPIYAGLQQPIIDSLMRGEMLHQALRTTGEFPQDFVDAIEVGEESGRLSESLFKLSQRYEENAKSAARTLTIFGSLAVWLAIGSLLVYLIFKFALLYIKLITDMSQPGWL